MNARSSNEIKLFDSGLSLPNGLQYKPEFISKSEENALISAFQTLPLHNAVFREFTAKRRVVGYGWEYDYRRDVLVPGEPLPAFLSLLVRKIGKWLDIPRSRIVEALVSEYRVSAGIGWHVDREKFEHIIGISLGGWCTMRWRPVSEVIKNTSGVNPLGLNPGFSQNEKTEQISIELEPRSVYVMQKEIRWQWQHSIPPTKTHRYSITFRTLSS